MIEFLYILGDTTLILVGVVVGVAGAVALIAVWCWSVEKYPEIAIPSTVAVTILVVTLIRYFGGGV